MILSGGCLVNIEIKTRQPIDSRCQVLNPTNFYTIKEYRENGIVNPRWVRIKDLTAKRRGILTEIKKSWIFQKLLQRVVWITKSVKYGLTKTTFVLGRPYLTDLVIQTTRWSSFFWKIHDFLFRLRSRDASPSKSLISTHRGFTIPFSLYLFYSIKIGRLSTWQRLSMRCRVLISIFTRHPHLKIIYEKNTYTSMIVFVAGFASAQTLYVPSGTSGIGTSSTSNVVSVQPPIRVRNWMFRSWFS